MKLKLLVAFMLLSNLLFAEKITVALAANVAYAIDDLKSEFNKLYPDIKVQIILGGTGSLTTKIKHKAPYDILMGANMMYPESLYKDGFAVTRPMVYAQGSLAYLSVKKQDFSKGINLVKESSVKRIAIANPKTAPYGKAAFEALRNAKLLDEVKSKFVYGESISQTVTYATKATDLGFIAKSALFSPKMKQFKKEINWHEVDSKLYTPINQGIVILKHGEKSQAVASFYAFIFSKRAEAIFEKFGYLIP